MNNDIYSSISQYFERTLSQYGPTAKGVDWKDESAQELRFKQLVKVLPDGLDEQETVVDFGCGYGQFFSYLKSQNLSLDYIGFDCLPSMIEQAETLYKGQEKCRFVCGNKFNIDCHYLVASGVFNFRGNFSNEDWTDFVLTELSRINAHTQKAFALNFLTAYSDQDRMREDLYYAQPEFLLNHCLKNFSRQVALLHDYGAYEFTLIVKKSV